MSEQGRGFYDVMQAPGSGAEGSRRGRQGRRNRQSRQGRQRRRGGGLKVFVILLALVILGGGAAVAYFGLQPTIASLMRGAPQDFSGPAGAEVTVKIASGATGQQIGQTLAAAGVVKSAAVFVAEATKDARAAGIQPGTYVLKKNLTAAAAIDLLLDPASRRVLTITIPEGLRAAQIYALLAKKTKLPVTDFRTAGAKATSWGLPAEAKGKIEGFLFPATYEFDLEVTADDIVKAMVQNAIKNLDDLGVPAKKRYITVTEASLVQAEGGRASDFPKIARVLNNRLAIGMPLQLDTTIHYATGHFTLTTSFADLKIESPYNTYKYAGLPIGPIASPGAEAIAATLKPTAGTWLYFVTVDPEKKITKFATTSAEFDALTIEWHAWQAKHPGQ